MTVVVDMPATSEETPLVLVVEDEDRARALRSDSLRSAGCVVIPADSAETALMVLRDGPSVDLIVTDIHLGDGEESKGGIRLARTVRDNYDSELPIAAYSGHFQERDIGEEDRNLFIATQARGTMSARQQKAFYASCRAHALAHKSRKVERYGSRLGDLPARTIATREFVFSGELDDVETVLESLGYELRLLSASNFQELAGTVAVWIRNSTDGAEVQVCGQPFLYFSADSEDEALVGLVRVMDGFASDFAKLQVEPVGPAKRLSDFLSTVMRNSRSSRSAHDGD